MDRRRFLTALGTAAGAGLVLPACGGLRASSGVPEGDPALVLRQPSIELLTGEDRRYAFLLVDASNRAIEAERADLYLATLDEEILDGPFEAERHTEGEHSLGVYRTHIDLPEAGQYYLIAVADGEKGQAPVDVLDPADSAFPAPGDPAVAVATPTVDDERGYERLCTADPDCGMHEISLDEALEQGRPVLLQFATPAYCQTAVCGPSVAIGEEVRTSQDWGDLVWVHVEIYTDEGQTVAGPVTEWNLPSEPWLYAIDRDGEVVERIDGPMVSEDFVDLARLLA